MFIEPAAYWRDDWLEREYESIFARRLYAGAGRALAAEGDYLAYRVCGRPLVTRRIDGRVASFDNVCLHRASLIDPEGQGNRPFRCGYHGWQYDADGALARAPMADGACIGRRRLERHATAEHAGLVFLSEPGHAADADAPGAGVLAAIGFQDGAPFHSETLAHRANWKLLVENVLESYHLSFVHGESFVPTGLSSASAWTDGYAGPDSWLRIANRADPGARGRVIPGADNDYLHAYVFPNLFVSLTGGLVGFVSHFKPNAPEHTLLEWSLFETPLLAAQKPPVRDFIRRNAVEFTRKVLNEDLAVLENSQIGVRHARGPHQLQPAEARLHHFHRTYREWMS
jgi:phenylpropionate dioxygenase-like ring-hydroxylating dioxygenase large terminal subunit